MLLAEDNLINQTVAKKMLGQMGMRCTVASNGAEAVDALRAAAATGQQFEVVLMDMAMPVMGGVDATKVSAGVGGFSLPLCISATDLRSGQENQAAGFEAKGRG